MLRQGRSRLRQRCILLQGRQLLPRQGWQGLRNDVEGPEWQDDLLCWRQVPDDVERQKRQELLWRQDVRTSASRSLMALVALPTR